jgi:hypothetical protein
LFPQLAIVSSAAISMGAEVALLSPDTYSFRYLPRPIRKFWFLVFQEPAYCFP